MTLKANTLQIIVIVATAIRERNDMVYLVAWLQSSVALALLAQSAIALEYPLSDGHPSAASDAISHLFSSHPLRICRHLDGALWSALLDHHLSACANAKSPRSL